MRIDGRSDPAAEGLRARRPRAAHAGAKEGLALINGTQFSTALALAGADRRERVAAAAFVAGALVGRRLRRQRHAVRRADPRRARPRRPGRRGGGLPRAPRGQRASACRTHGRPAGAGPVLPALPAAGDGRLPRRRRATRRATLLVEANAVTDNPLVFVDDRRDPLRRQLPRRAGRASPPTSLALAIAEIGALSERRIALLIDANLSGLPPFLVRDGGAQLGLHDRPGDGGGAGRREQGARAPRAASTRCRPRPTRRTTSVDGDQRGAPPAADGGAHGGDRRHRAAGRRAGDRSARAAGDIAASRRRAGRGADAGGVWDRDRAFAPDLARMRARVEAGDFLDFVPAAADGLTADTLDPAGTRPAESRESRGRSAAAQTTPGASPMTRDDPAACRPLPLRRSHHPGAARHRAHARSPG